MFERCAVNRCYPNRSACFGAVVVLTVLLITGCGSPGAATVTVSEADFESVVLSNEKPVMVDMWAPWCGPCKAIGPVIDEISKDYEGKVKFFKCNCWEKN